MKSALYIVEAGKIQIAVTDGDGVVNTFDQVRQGQIFFDLFCCDLESS
jgi:hypothetical protein